MERKVYFILAAMFLLCGFGFCLKNCSECKGNVTLLNLMVLVSQTEPTDFSTYIPGVDVALDIINNDCSILPCYYLNHTDIINPECSDTPAVHGFIEHVSNQALNEIVIIGADCSVSTQPVASLAPFWNLVQISTVSTSPRLSDNKEYPTFLRVVAPDNTINPGIIKLMQHYGWEHIAVITQEEDIFTFTRDDLEIKLQQNNLKLVHSVSFSTNQNPQSSVNSLKRSSGRVIFLNCYHDYAIEILCQAASLGMTPPNYAWITFGWYLNDFWLKSKIKNRTKYEEYKHCTEADILAIVNQLILIHQYPRYDVTIQNRAIGNISIDEYWQRYNLKANATNIIPGVNHPDQSEDSTLSYDAVWVAAKALHKTEEHFKLNETTNLTLKDFWNTNSSIGKTISDEIYKNALEMSFYGVSGNLRFLYNGDREPELRFYVYRGDQYDENLFKRYIFGNFTDEEELNLFPSEIEFLFPDGVPVTFKHEHVSIPLFVVYSLLAAVGIIFAILCLIFNCIFSNKMIVRLSSPLLNVILIVGVMMIYMLTVLIGIGDGMISLKNASGLCQFRIWIAVLSFSLIYGAILSKTFKVFYIFKKARSGKPADGKKAIQSWHMLLLIGILIVIDLVFLIVVTSIPDAILKAEILSKPITDGGLPTKYTVCASPSSHVWIPILLTYKGIEILFSLFFAFETRKIKVKELNDSRMIIFSVYSIVIAAIALVPMTFLLNDEVNIVYGIVGAICLVIATALLLLNFAPKMIHLYKDHSGEINMDFTNVVNSWTKNHKHNSKNQVPSQGNTECKSDCVHEQAIASPLEQSTAQ